jgi:subtilisin
MRKSIHSIITMLAAILLLGGCAEEKKEFEQAAFELQSVDALGKYIVVLKPGADARGLAVASGVTPSHVFSRVLNGFAVELPAPAVEALSKNPNVEYIAVDREVQAYDQTVPTGVQRMGVLANEIAAIDGIDERVNVNVAVLDTGIDLDHEDLNVVGGVNCNAKSRTYDDEYGHGTHVAGTIGALDNGIGAVGVAPGANLYAVRVLDRKGSGYASDIICGIEWVAERADTIKIANMSLGGPGADDGNCGYTNKDPEHQAICNAVSAGVTFIVAAGNESDDAANHTPAAFDEVITVSALADFNGLPGGGAAPTCRTDEDDSLANFSNFGPDVDIMAPGVCIYSTHLRGGYETMSGTSMATPHVAGAAALILAENPSLSAAQLRHELLTRTDPAPCASSDGVCVDDPDSVQEPFSLMGALVEAVCGDGLCFGDEDCLTCDADCGACPYCGDGDCNGTEDCSSCETDCGLCPSCGDGACNGDETCETCEDDCGVCPAVGGMCSPCSTGAECESGLCLLGSQSYCTVSCNVKKNNCPDGSTCKRITGVQVCVADDGCPL